ncbi:tRNA pseudouridine(55) synthase TruB [Buchnera aphidicola str. APS (Acyrthosiphon pisum)]|uniref:tRNA pseudouridine synthase B n=2 Tax=Buchnera aphidicola TaxID=9 RepID=TRUB_BUCAI|nr:tRNA pseudouridine(55) synthase TruB [Buchnera aphidicola]P57456.1 RecName: Full=tRNA pseudouridine synthase B; AltName: Full=tRNA pseudouridine(55) synthase; Short=Psi55 synthase; AltName: Full=tRNA pseudouridylate synthase; AltName: Full=tRNA-uridine isomerase [Buchnera aphidicola str. APS (Acyrthosiphon pisum)]pir/G84973/ tRNA pseudouridine 55 synthase [imported] - Buchnera sp. (strain APS) [Buchnera sp. (in: enterobacteria)]OQX99163.1 MAG: tRNA pseudouridine(55) synthase TruB [Erwiniaceae
MFFHKKRDVHGLLLLDKPQGISSNNALQKVKMLFSAKKAGYIGTLDPLATGMLPICFGECSKFSHYLMESNKKYHVIAKLGEKTSTSDSDGIIIKKRPILINSFKIKSALKELTGLIEQIPPMYSAIKHNGVPLYKYARQGLNIKRSIRKVLIHDISSIHQEKNLIEFKIFCSKGTYVRTLVEDLGEKLGCGAHVIFLRRLEMASYLHSQLVTISYLHKLLRKEKNNNFNFFEKIDNLLMPIDSPVSFLPKVYLFPQQSYNFQLGQTVIFFSDIKNSLVRVIALENNKFIGLGRINTEELLIPYRLVSRSIN